MNVSDPIADMLTRIRNALMAKKEEASIPFSTLKLKIAEILKIEGYVNDFRVEDGRGPKKEIVIVLKYKKGQSVIQDLKRISSPGRRMYVSYHDLPFVLDDLGVAIISTSAGIMTNKEARKKKIGGEVVCEIY